MRRVLPRPPSPEVAVLAGVAFSVAVGFGIVAPALPVFARSFHVSHQAAGAVISIFAFMRLVSALGSGRLVNAFGERLVLAAGMGIVAVSRRWPGDQTYFQLPGAARCRRHRLGDVHGLRDEPGAGIGGPG